MKKEHIDEIHSLLFEAIKYKLSNDLEQIKAAELTVALSWLKTLDKSLERDEITASEIEDKKQQAKTIRELVEAAQKNK